MNAADRQSRQFDDAAAQAKRDGGSSFGNPAREPDPFFEWLFADPERSAAFESVEHAREAFNKSKENEK